MRKFLAIVIISLVGYTSSYAQRTDVQGIVQSLQIDSLVQYVQELSGERTVWLQGEKDSIRSRYFSHPDHAKARAYLKQKLEGYGYNLSMQKYSESGQNIVATKTGTDYPDEYIILGAHYDSKPIGDISPGANDNASGVAALLEIARVVQNIDFPYSVSFVFFDEEEIGLLGSQAYAQSFGAFNERLLAYINLDMLAWDTGSDLTEVHVRDIANSMSVAEKVFQCNEWYEIGLQLQRIEPGTMLSDHASFWRNQHTAIAINEVYSGADSYPYIHTVADTLGHFNLPYYLRNVQLAASLLGELAWDGLTITGLSEIPNTSTPFRVFPNPTSGDLQVVLDNWTGHEGHVFIYDVRGNLLHQQEIHSPRLPLSIDFPPAIYYLKIQVGNEFYTRSIVKF